MLRTAPLAAALVLLVTPALAEVRFTLPLPDPNLPDGVLTVKVAGQDMRDLRVGQQVELLEAEGDKVVKTASTGEDGRARFEGLEPSKRYVIRVKVEGQEHRSAAVAGPSSGGARLLLTLGAEVPVPQGQAQALPPGHPTDLPPGHPPTGESHDHGTSGAAQLEPDPELAPDKVRVLVLRGKARKPLSGARVQVVEEEGRKRSELGRTDADGRSETRLAHDRRYAVLVSHDGLTFSSRAFTLPASAKQGTRVTFQVFDRIGDVGKLALGPGSHWVAQVGEGVVRFMQVMQLENGTDAIVDPGESGLELPLPAGARNLELPDELKGLVGIDAAHNAARLTAPVPPGGLPVRVFFELPFDSSSLELRQELPLALPGRSVLVLVNATERVKVGGPAVTGEGRPTERGMAYPLSGVKAGGRLEVSLSNLPYRDNRLFTAVLVLAGLIALWAILAAARGPQRAESRQSRKEKLLQQLVQARKAKAKGKGVKPERQAELIQELKQVWEEPW